MEVTGKLHIKYDAQQVTASFTKREFVLMIADNPQYPQYVVFQLTQEKCGFLDSFQVGNDVKVAFNLRGREWKSPQGELKFFNTIEAWSIMPLGTKTQQQPIHANENFSSAEAAPPQQENDDLPF